jgi:hypothetical protein
MGLDHPFRHRGKKAKALADSYALFDVLAPPHFTHHSDKLAQVLTALLSRPEQWTITHFILPESGRNAYKVVIDGSVVVDREIAEAIQEVADDTYPPKVHDA